MFLSPLGLEFGWREIPQRRMDPLVDIHVIQEASELLVGVIIVMVFRQVQVLFLGYHGISPSSWPAGPAFLYW